jgi:glutamate-1-semialdehyde 2,1-aminomutase
LSQVFTPEFATALHERGEKLRERLNALFEARGLALQATGRSSLMNLHATAAPIRAPADAAKGDDRVRELIFLDLLEAGYYIARRGFIALSLAVSDADLDGFIAALGKILDDRRDVLPGRA